MIALYIVGGIGGALIGVFIGGAPGAVVGFVAGVFITLLAFAWLGSSLGHKL